MLLQHSSAIFRSLISISVCLFLLSSVVSAQQETVETKHRVINGREEDITIIHGDKKSTIKTVTHSSGHKWRSQKIMIDSVNDQITIVDTFFRENGTINYINTHRVSEGLWVSTEKIEYDGAGDISKGRKYEREYETIRWRLYYLDLQTGLYNDVGVPISDEDIDLVLQTRRLDGTDNWERHIPPPKDRRHAMVCPAPNSRIFVGYAYMNRDDGGEKVAYGGVDASYTRFFADNFDNTDTLTTFPRPVRQIGAGVSVIYITSYYEEAHYNIAAITVGPDLQYSWSNFSAGLFLHVGMLSDGFKYGDYKDHESNFTVNPGAHIEYRFIKNNSIGVALRPQFLLTKQDDKSKMNFLISGGVSMNFGCHGNK